MIGSARAMLFKNREEAARRLSEKLVPYRGQNPLVLAIPRGAMGMAEVITEALEGELDVVLVHKLRAPDQPELAIGSVDESGHVYVREYARTLGIREDYLEAERREQMKVLRERRAMYTPVHSPINPSGRIVIVVDDGIATGSTMIAALHALRAKKPEKLIAAVAVASLEAFQAIEKMADEVVCLDVPERFYAVGQFFREFNQVTDQEVIAILQKSRSRPNKG
jgi:putative phosphoribosyl transferase